MSDEATELPDAQPGIPGPAGRGTAWVLAIVFAILFAAPLFYAISNLIEYPAFAGGRTPWWLLVAAVVAPPVLYVAGLLVSRGRTPVLRTVVLGAALGTANGLTISGIALAITLLNV